MKIPIELKHKPVIVSEDYDLVDGRNAPKSEAKGLSLGLAQWNDRGKVEISAKIWRHTGNKWSRQSEEIPLHRVIDLAILICRTKIFFSEMYHNKGKEYPKIDRIGMQGRAMNVSVCEDNPYIEEDIKLFDKCLRKDDELIGERLKILSSMLKEMGY